MQRDTWPEFWVDELLEKHECGGYRDPQAVSLVHDGRQITLLVPFAWTAKDILSITISESGEVLYLVAEGSGLDYDPLSGGLLICARRREADVFATVVWHELYPWALKYLGLRDIPRL